MGLRDVTKYRKELNNGKKFYRVEKQPEAMYVLHNEPWRAYTEPFRVAPHVYMVSGNSDWFCYILDSGEGLILIDTSMNPIEYLLVDSIYRAGFDIRDIKKVLITHGHRDHDGGARMIKELSEGNAEIYFPPRDVEYKKAHETMYTGSKDPLYFDYEVDHLYDYDKPIELGRFSIKLRNCPGHTPGVTTYFFDDTDEETGKTYHIAMHGGSGVGGKKGDEFNDLRIQFIHDCREMANMDIDIAIPSHGNQVNFLAWVPEDRNDYTPFVDKNTWHDLMIERADAAEKITDMH